MTYSRVSLPLLVAVIDDFAVLDYSDYSHSISEKINDIMRMSHAVAVTIICAS